jgi:hypothetical protein
MTRLPNVALALEVANAGPTAAARQAAATVFLT